METTTPHKFTVTAAQLNAGNVPLYTPNAGDLWLAANLFRTVAFDAEVAIAVGPPAYGGMVAWHVGANQTDDEYGGWQILSNSDFGYGDEDVNGPIFKQLPIRAPQAGADPLVAMLNLYGDAPTTGAVDIYLHIARAS